MVAHAASPHHSASAAPLVSSTRTLFAPASPPAILSAMLRSASVLAVMSAAAAARDVDRSLQVPLPRATRAAPRSVPPLLAAPRSIAPRRRA